MTPSPQLTPSQLSQNQSDLIAALAGAHDYARRGLSDEEIKAELIQEAQKRGETLHPHQIEIFRGMIVGEMRRRVQERLAVEEKTSSLSLRERVISVFRGWVGGLPGLRKRRTDDQESPVLLEKERVTEDVESALKIALPLRSKIVLSSVEKGVALYHSPLGGKFVLRPTGHHPQASNEGGERSLEDRPEPDSAPHQPPVEDPTISEVSQASGVSGVYELDVGIPKNLDPRARAKAALAQKFLSQSAPFIGPGEIAGRAYDCSRYVEGEDLESLLEKGELTLEKKKEIAYQAAQALHELHEQGLFHMDIKPGNIVVEFFEDGSLKVTLIDLERVLDASGYKERSGSSKGVNGTHSYMPPESHAVLHIHDTDAKAAAVARDFYSFGLTLSKLFDYEVALPQVQERIIEGHITWEGYKQSYPDLNLSERRARLTQDLISLAERGYELRLEKKEGIFDSTIAGFISQLIHLRWPQRPQSKEFMEHAKTTFKS